jgi:hypothetical protein
VKTLCADASVDFVDVKVGHCQALDLKKTNPRRRKLVGVFLFLLPRHEQQIERVRLADSERSQCGMCLTAVSGGSGLSDTFSEPISGRICWLIKHGDGSLFNS